MELKDVFGEIEADGAHLVHGRLLEWALTPPLWHAEAVGGRPHHQSCTCPFVTFQGSPKWRRSNRFPILSLNSTRQAFWFTSPTRSVLTKFQVSSKPTPQKRY